MPCLRLSTFLLTHFFSTIPLLKGLQTADSAHPAPEYAMFTRGFKKLLAHKRFLALLEPAESFKGRHEAALRMLALSSPCPGELEWLNLYPSNPLTS